MKLSSLLPNFQRNKPVSNENFYQTLIGSADEIYEKNKEHISGDTKIYSDIISADGKYQYVNLVQEGGGILGIALVGYTYILEKAGLRFLKMAGTSAGAINTVILASTKDEPEQFSSTRAIEHLIKLKMFNFVDGHYIAKKLIQNIITTEGYSKQLVTSFLFFIGASLGLLFVSSILQWQNYITNVYMICGVLMMASLSILAYQRAKKREMEDNKDEKKAFLEVAPTKNKTLIFTSLLWKMAAAFVLIVVAGIALHLIKNKCPNFDVISAIDVISICILIAILFFLKKRFDKDLIAIGSLIFLTAPVLTFAVALVFPHYITAVILLTIGGIVAVVLLFLYRSDLPNKELYIPTVVVTCLIVYGGFVILTHSENAENFASNFSFISLTAVGLCTFLIMIIGGFTLYLYARFHDAENGINKGNYFLFWLRDVLKEGNNNKDVMLADLKQIYENNAQNIKQRVGNKSTESLDKLTKFDVNDSPIVFITSDITTLNKVELPKMQHLYWNKTEPVYVADFVRASMSIPFFFEPYKRENIPQDNSQEWKDLLNYNFPNDNSLDVAYFVDGGLLSNFPFNIFHRPQIKHTRLPTFGVRLKSDENKPKTSFKDISEYAGAMLSAARANFDRDFLVRNPYYNQCIHEIDVHEYNWLNFFVTETEKLELFKKGAEAACEFLKNFNWENYKNQRDETVAKLCP